MKKLLGLLILFLLIFPQNVAAQSLAERREELIESFMGGITEQFTYEEVEEYISAQEAEVLETGIIYKGYGINGQHSFAHGLNLGNYLRDYLAANTSPEELANLYPHAIDFSQMPSELNFVKAGGDSEIIYTIRPQAEGKTLEIFSVKGFNDSFDNRDTLNVPVENNGTKEYIFEDSLGHEKSVKVNTSASYFSTPYRTEYQFVFFYNPERGVSMLVFEGEGEESFKQEYVSLEQVGFQGEYSDTSIDLTSIYQSTLDELIPTINESFKPYNYAVYDIDGNGTLELIISEGEDIRKIFTYHPDSKSLILIPEIDFGSLERAHVVISPDGNLFFMGSNGASNSIYMTYRFNSDGISLDTIYAIDFNIEKNQEAPYSFIEDLGVSYTEEEIHMLTNGYWFRGSEASNILSFDYHHISVPIATWTTIPSFGSENVQTNDQLQESEAMDFEYAGYISWLPQDWHRTTPRKSVAWPDVTWLLMSQSSDLGHLVVEPFVYHDEVLSGYTDPGVIVTVILTTQEGPVGDPYDIYYEVIADDKGYFEVIMEKVSYFSKLAVKRADGSASIDNLMIYDYRPTALDHPSGYLSVDRYFLGQEFVEGYAYPYADVRIRRPSGYATTAETIQADAQGYFFFNFYSQDQSIAPSITVKHPDTGEDISVTAYPWTQEELDKAYW